MLRTIVNRQYFIILSLKEVLMDYCRYLSWHEKLEWTLNTATQLTINLLLLLHVLEAPQHASLGFYVCHPAAGIPWLPTTWHISQASLQVPPCVPAALWHAVLRRPRLNRSVTLHLNHTLTWITMCRFTSAEAHQCSFLTLIPFPPVEGGWLVRWNTQRQCASN